MREQEKPPACQPDDALINFHTTVHRMQIALPRPGARDLVRMSDGLGNHCNERGEGQAGGRGRWRDLTSVVLARIIISF
jgi:hypothetical protein